MSEDKEKPEDEEMYFDEEEHERLKVSSYSEHQHVQGRYKIENLKVPDVLYMNLDESDALKRDKWDIDSHGKVHPCDAQYVETAQCIWDAFSPNLDERFRMVINMLFVVIDSVRFATYGLDRMSDTKQMQFFYFERRRMDEVMDPYIYEILKYHHEWVELLKYIHRSVGIDLDWCDFDMTGGKLLFREPPDNDTVEIERYVRDVFNSNRQFFDQQEHTNIYMNTFLNRDLLNLHHIFFQMKEAVNNQQFRSRKDLIHIHIQHSQIIFELMFDTNFLKGISDYLRQECWNNKRVNHWHGHAARCWKKHSRNECWYEIPEVQPLGNGKLCFTDEECLKVFSVFGQAFFQKHFPTENTDMLFIGPKFDSKFKNATYLCTDPEESYPSAETLWIKCTNKNPSIKQKHMQLLYNDLPYSKEVSPTTTVVEAMRANVKFQLEEELMEIPLYVKCPICNHVELLSNQKHHYKDLPANTGDMQVTCARTGGTFNTRDPNTGKQLAGVSIWQSKARLDPTWPFYIVVPSVTHVHEVNEVIKEVPARVLKIFPIMKFFKSPSPGLRRHSQLCNAYKNLRKHILEKHGLEGLDKWALWWCFPTDERAKEMGYYKEEDAQRIKSFSNYSNDSLYKYDFNCANYYVPDKGDKALAKQDNVDHREHRAAKRPGTPHPKKYASPSKKRTRTTTSPSTTPSKLRRSPRRCAATSPSTPMRRSTRTITKRELFPTNSPKDKEGTRKNV